MKNLRICLPRLSVCLRALSILRSALLKAIMGYTHIMSNNDEPKQKTPKGEEIPVPKRRDFAGLDLRMR